MAYRIVTRFLRIGIGLEKYILIIFTHAWLSLAAAAAAYQSQAVSQQHKERNEKAAQHKKTKLNSEAFLLLHLLSFREKASFFLLPN